MTRRGLRARSSARGTTRGRARERDDANQVVLGLRVERLLDLGARVVERRVRARESDTSTRYTVHTFWVVAVRASRARPSASSATNATRRSTESTRCGERQVGERSARSSR